MRNSHLLPLYLTLLNLWSSPPLALLAQEAPSPEIPNPGLVSEYFEMSPEELLNVSTTLTTGDAQDWMETPAAAYVITKEDMNLSGHNHIAEHLRQVPGLHVSQNSTNSWAISTRSFEHVFADMQLVLQDGREIFSPSFGGVFWDLADLPVEILDSIEVIRGPGATLWGSNAVNGIINIQTLDAIQAQENVISVGAGNRDYAHFSFRQGGEIFGGHYYTWGKVASHRTVHDPNPNPQIDTYPEYEMQKFGLRTDLPGFGEEGWTLRAEYFNNEATRRFGGPYHITLDPNTFQPNSLTLLQDFLGPDKSHGGNVHGEWGGTFGDNFSWELISYYAHNHHNWKGTGLNFLIDTYEVDLKVGKTIGRHDLLGGIRYRNHDFNLKQLYIPSLPPVPDGSVVPLFNFPQQNISEDLTSLFLQDTIRLRDNLHLLVGTKYEDNVTGEQWNPSARLWWNKNERSTCWFAYSNASQLPGMVYRWGTVATAYTQLPDNSYLVDGIDAVPSLKPAELEQWEIGNRYIFSENLSLDIAAFYGQYDKLTAFGSQLVLQTEFNTDTAETYGGELALNWHPFNTVQIRSSVSYSDLDIEGIAAGTTEYSQANWRGNLSAVYTPNKNHSYHLHLYATERAFVEVPGYIRTDIGTTWTPNQDWEISLQIQNLFDPSHPENFSSFFGPLPHEVSRTAYLQIRRWF